MMKEPRTRTSSRTITISERRANRRPVSPGRSPFAVHLSPLTSHLSPPPIRRFADPFLPIADPPIRRYADPFPLGVAVCAHGRKVSAHQFDPGSPLRVRGLDPRYLTCPP